MTKSTPAKKTNLTTQKNGKEFTSSMVKAYTYDHDAETLDVTFINKNTYRYSGVEEKTFEALLEAESKGTFINESVKGTHAYEKLS